MRFIALLSSMLLFGCASEKVPLQRSGLTNLTKQTLLACLGQPNQHERQGHQEYLSYSRMISDPMCPMKSIFNVQPWVHHCQLEFTLIGDKVSNVSFQQTDEPGAPSGNQCSLLLVDCGKQPD